LSTKLSSISGSGFLKLEHFRHLGQIINPKIIAKIMATTKNINFVFDFDLF